MYYSINEYQEIRDRSSINNIEVEINSIEEYKELLEIKGKENISIIINKSIMKELLNNNIVIDSDINIILKIENMSNLSNKELDKLISINNFKTIRIFKDGKGSGYNDYSINDYKELYDQIIYILSFIDEDESELEKFLTIYKIIGESIYYDNYFDFYSGSKPSDWIDNQNLIRRIIRRNYCMCRIFRYFKTNIIYCWN